MSEFKEKIFKFLFNLSGDDIQTMEQVKTQTETVMSLISQSESKETDSNEVKDSIDLFLELIDLFFDSFNKEQKENIGAQVDLSRVSERLAKAILQAGYTKNKGEKVYTGKPLVITANGNRPYDTGIIYTSNEPKLIQVFIREVE